MSQWEDLRKVLVLLYAAIALPPFHLILTYKMDGLHIYGTMAYLS
jgi:hypothetical protein